MSTVKPELTTTSEKGPPSFNGHHFEVPIFSLYNIELPLNNDTCQQRPQILGTEGGRCKQV
jgi:hypothetical protein